MSSKNTIKSSRFSSDFSNKSSSQSTNNRSQSNSPKSTKSETETFASSESLRINFKELKSECEVLKKYSNYQIDNLPPHILKKIEAISHLATTSKARAIYKEFIEVINDVFGDEEMPKPRTVGAFFKGCFNGSNFDGPLGCSAECAGNISPPNIAGWECCKENVGTYRNGKLEICHRNPSSNSIIIHIIDRDYENLSKADLDLLTSLDIKSASINLYVNGKYTLQTNSVSIDKLHSQLKSGTDSDSINKKNLKCPESESDSRSGSKSDSKSGSKSGSKSDSKSCPKSRTRSDSTRSDSRSCDSRSGFESTSGFGYIIAIIVIVIIIIVLICLAVKYRSGSSYNSGMASSTRTGFSSW